jgi:hypothetical protein
VDTGRADLSVGPTATARDSTGAPERVGTNADRFVYLPVRFRREHREWSNSEHAAWLDLFLASLEVEGRFDSIEVARAYLGNRAGALEALMARDAFIDVDGFWMLADFLELYDGRRPRHYKTLAERLADADARQARGEALLPIERWARWKARQRAKPSEMEEEEEKDKETGAGHKERDRANVGQTLANVDSYLTTDNLYRTFEGLVGMEPSFKERSDIDAMCRRWGQAKVRNGMLQDPEPKRNPDKFIGRLWHRLKEGEVAA